MTNRCKWVSTAVLSGMLLLTACGGKKTTKATPPTTPAPVAPTATLAASPNVIQQGQSTTLTWQTTGATQIAIAGLGTVAASGSRSVSPNSSQTYTLTASGTGGSTEANATVTVNPRVTASAPSSPIDEKDLLARSLKDVFFDFNVAAIRNTEVSTTENDARLLAQHPNVDVLIEGHCDDRGSEEYNLALGVNRASSVKESLIRQGVPAARIKTVSFGKEKPFCTQQDEACWQQNRRDHFVVQR